MVFWSEFPLTNRRQVRISESAFARFVRSALPIAARQGSNLQTEIENESLVYE